MVYGGLGVWDGACVNTPSSTIESDGGYWPGDGDTYCRAGLEEGLILCLIDVSVCGPLVSAHLIIWVVIYMPEEIGQGIGKESHPHCDQMEASTDGRRSTWESAGFTLTLLLLDSVRKTQFSLHLSD